MKKILTRKLPAFCLIPAALLPYASLAEDTRPATLIEAGGNPLTLNAAAFLTWYWQTFIVLIVTGFIVQYVNKIPSGIRGNITGIRDNPYLLAYIKGGPDHVINTALTSLITQGSLRINIVSRSLVTEAPVNDNQPAIEKQLYQLLKGGQSISSQTHFHNKMKKSLSKSLDSMKHKLQQANLITRPRFS